MSKNWILIRGLARHSQHWGTFSDMFVKAHAGDFVEFLDLCGNGTQNELSSFLKISDYTDDLRLRSKSIAKNEKVNIVAISMGAMVAIDWVNRYPKEVESITTINTSDGGSSKFWQRLQPESYKILAKILFYNQNPYEREKLSLDLITNLLKNKAEVAKQFSGFKVTSRINFFRQIFAASQFRFPKNKPNCEITMICSNGDRLVSSQCTKIFVICGGSAPWFTQLLGMICR
ncbi:MAG: alpha/beta hydrolase [Oligoflexia bacterium]|nr:alpha/beta hydrolase [Oligoflexia bacterium]